MCCSTDIGIMPNSHKISYVLEHFDIVEKVRHFVFEIRKDLLSLALKNKITEKNFYKITSLLNPQSRSTLWQDYFVQKNQYEQVKAKEDKGDFKVGNKYYEYKVSGFNVGNVLHLVQIRPWQECSYIIQSIQKDKVFTFELTNKQMKKEIKLCHGSSAHGTKTANIDNKNKELRMTIKIGDSNWERWLKLYKIH